MEQLRAKKLCNREHARVRITLGCAVADSIMRPRSGRHQQPAISTNLRYAGPSSGILAVGPVARMAPEVSDRDGVELVALERVQEIVREPAHEDAP